MADLRASSVSHPGSNAIARSALPDSPARSPTTAYNGAAGYIDDSSIPSHEADRQRHEKFQSHTANKSVSPQREGLGSRLLSTLSNAQPAAEALRRSGSVLHSRTKSWAAYVPKLNPSANTAPEKSQFTPSNRIFGDLFSGESAPVRLGIPTSPQEEPELVMEYRSGFTERPARQAQRTDTSASALPQQRPRSSWFGRKSTTPACPTTTSTTQDAFATMNVHTSLFPDGPVDPLSPHAFNDLLLNATDLLQRMQAAYREKVEYISSIQPELDAQREEAEEAETRAQHLKLQLEDTCRRAQEQERANRELALELSRARLKMQEPAPKTVRLVRRASQEIGGGDEDESNSTTPRRLKRDSAGSASDSGFESDADTASLFSSGLPAASAPFSPTPRMTLTSVPDYDGRAWGGSATGPKGLVLAAGRRDADNKPRIDGASPAWSTVEKLRSENVALQRQLDEMHQSLQSVIDFVGTVGGI